ncbi:hypothetical protein Tco_0649108 [Tanacetum coccineum]
MYTFSPMMVANSLKHHCRVRLYTLEVLVISTNLDIQKNHYPLDFTNRKGVETRIKNTCLEVLMTLFEDQENSEDIFSFGSALEDFICVVFVPDGNILGYEEATPEGAKLNQTPLKFEAHLLSPNGPRKFDSTLMPSVRLGIPICLNSASQAALVMKQTTTK